MVEDINQVPERVEHNYGAGEIDVLEGLEAVRKRPGMYIGSTGPRGLHHLVYEIVDNAIDEAMAGYCKNIVVDILPGNIVSCKDDGRGIPTGIHPKLGISAVTVVYTVLHAGGKFGSGGYGFSGGLHGVGASVVNALSEWLEVEVYQNGKIYFQRFERGVPVTELIEKGTTDKQGTFVTFKADDQVFEELDYDYELLLTRLREQAFLNAGLNIELSDLREEDHPLNSKLHYEGGIRSFVSHLNDRKGGEVTHPDVIFYSGAENGNLAEVALQYNDSYNETILSFANNINTVEGGTHETGFKTALTRVFNDYGRKYGILKENDKNLSGEDVREGITVVINVKVKEAQFEGQTKSKLGNTEMRTMVDNLTYDKLATYFEENPAVAKAILNKSLLAARAREAARKAREASRKRTNLDRLSMAEKLADCIETDITRTEIYIVEGDSAGGSAKGGRDRRFQAILPLWGKMLNVEKARAEKIYGNDKLDPLIAALGCGIGADFDLSKLRYGRVIIMADADVDGSHIRTLLLTFFFRFMRPLVENGHIYIAQPPLFKISKGKKFRYAFTERERDRMTAELNEEVKQGKTDVQRYKGLGEMDSEQLWETTMNPDTRTMLQVELENAAAADEIFTMLMGEKVEPRRDFITRNARYVTNLDV